MRQPIRVYSLLRCKRIDERLGNAAFGACCGVSIAAACAFATISLPETRKYHYSDTLTLGAITGSSNLSILIPPSFGFILFGALTQTSIAKLFVGGIIPGIILAAMFLIVAYFIIWRNPEMGPPGPKTTWRAKARGAVGMWTLVIIFGGIIGGLYLGLFTPTEAGAAGAFTVLLIGLARRRISWTSFVTALRDSSVTIGMVGLLLVASMILNLFLVVTQVPRTIAVIITTITTDPIACVAVIVGILLILGCFIDALALTLLMTPIFYPIVTGLGVDPVHYGIIQGMAMGIGSLTPPFGILVYAATGTAKDVPLFDVFRGAAPFLFANLINIGINLFNPQICLFLPGLMFPALR